MKNCWKSDSFDLNLICLFKCVIDPWSCISNVYPYGNLSTHNRATADNKKW